MALAMAARIDGDDAARLFPADLWVSTIPAMPHMARRGLLRVQFAGRNHSESATTLITAAAAISQVLDARSHGSMDRS